MANCNFTALPQEDVMAVGNASMTFDVKSNLPAIVNRDNVEIVAWNGKDGIIEYNDRLRITETFLDLAPYVDLVRAWLWAAEEQLSLAQAKLVMRDFIDALYISKRQLPYGGYTAKDDDIFYNTARLVAGGSSGIVPEVNARIDGINSRFDSTCYWLNLRPQSNTFRQMHLGQAAAPDGGWTDLNNGAVVGIMGGTYGVVQARWASLEAYSPSLGWNGFARGSSPQHDSVSLTGLTHISGGTGDTVPWETAAGQINTLSYDQANTLLRGILNRSRDLLTIKAAKINAMLALTALPAVIDFDLTGSW